MNLLKSPTFHLLMNAVHCCEVKKSEITLHCSFLAEHILFFLFVRLCTKMIKVETSHFEGLSIIAHFWVF